MPGPTRWLLSALLLLACRSYAADYPTFNTCLSWRSDMQEAATEAQSTGRLLFVMHLSGNLAKNEFT